jgi:DNA-binding MarR family transcriptional regulator
LRPTSSPYSGRGSVKSPGGRESCAGCWCSTRSFSSGSSPGSGTGCDRRIWSVCWHSGEVRSTSDRGCRSARCLSCARCRTLATWGSARRSTAMPARSGSSGCGIHRHRADVRCEVLQGVPRSSGIGKFLALRNGPGYNYAMRSTRHVAQCDGDDPMGHYSDPPLLVLASLASGPKHGHAMIEDIASLCGTRLGPGTLYGAIARLEQRGWIEPLPAEERRRPYRITRQGARVLHAKLTILRKFAIAGIRRLEVA